jgi:hypothetical protein
VAPPGLDATYLWGASLHILSLTMRVQGEFAEDLRSRSGKLAQLLYCANVIRLADKESTSDIMIQTARGAADDLLSALRL